MVRDDEIGAGAFNPGEDLHDHLALIEPRGAESGGEGDGRFLESLREDSGTFKVVITSRPRGSIPTNLWTSSYFVFFQSL